MSALAHSYETAIAPSPTPVALGVITPLTENTFTEQVPPNGWQRKPGHRAGCTRCGWTSGRYDKQITAELVADNHAERMCAIG